MRKPKCTLGTPSHQDKPEQSYVEQLHADCGGRVVLVARAQDDWRIACIRCATSWGFDLPIPPYRLSIGPDFKPASDLRSPRKPDAAVRDGGAEVGR